MIKKPQKPWKNIEDAKVCINLYNVNIGQASFPCIKCLGRGSIRDIKDLDPIEGYKLAPLYPCRDCCSTGISTKSVFMVYYRQQIHKYREAMKSYKYKVARFKELTEKLSADDLAILRQGL